MTTPRYLRFAQALALCSGLATVPACPSSTMMGTDSGPPGTDAPAVEMDAPSGEDAPIAMTDAPSTGDDAPSTGDDAPSVLPDAPVAVGDAGDLCPTCQCFAVDDAGPDGLPNCDTVGLASCCFAVGPLSPPDLPA